MMRLNHSKNTEKVVVRASVSICVCKGTVSTGTKRSQNHSQEINPIFAIFVSFLKINQSGTIDLASIGDASLAEGEASVTNTFCL